MGRRVFAAIAVSMTVLGLGACDGASSSNETSAAVSTDHHYSMKDGEAYGYEHALSEEDQKSGVASKSLEMFRYAGVEAGVYRLVIGDKSDPYEITCEKPCKFMKTFEVGKEDKAERHAFDTTSIMGSAMEDAQAGKLAISPSAVKDVEAAKQAAAASN